MFLWIMIFIGTLLFALGLYNLIKNYRIGKYNKKYGLISYTGFSIALIGALLLMEPIFISLPENLSTALPCFILLFTCIILSQLLLKPTFLKNKNNL